MISHIQKWVNGTESNPAPKPVGSDQAPKPKMVIKTNYSNDKKQVAKGKTFRRKWIVGDFFTALPIQTTSQSQVNKKY